MVDAILKAFEVTDDGMREVMRLITQEFHAGLDPETVERAKVKMLVTYVHSLPDGTEKGDFLALDLGGSNFRVLLINIEEGGKITQSFDKMVIDHATKTSKQEVLFDFIADKVAAFMKKKNITKKLPLGFTFSFPVNQTSLTSGTLIRWTKDFKASGAEGKDIIQLLRAAFQRRGDVEVDVVALVNDTTGTQMAIGLNNPDCHVGLILGTGTNACYTERLEAVKKFKGDRAGHTHVIINTEWGAFGDFNVDEHGKPVDKGILKDFLTCADKELNTEVENPGQQIYEKMISGKYLGELVRLVLVKLSKQGLVFDGKSSEKLEKFESFDTADVSAVEKGESIDVESCKALLMKTLGVEASDADCKLVRRVCEAVTVRAARLAAAGIVALVTKIDKLDKCTVAVDGSLYKLHPWFQHRMREALDMLGGKGITMKESTDGSGRGAAMVAAVAVRLKHDEAAA